MLLDKKVVVENGVIVSIIDTCETFAVEMPHKFNVVTNIFTKNVFFEIINAIENKVYNFLDYEKALIYWKNIYNQTHNKAVLNKSSKNIDLMVFVELNEPLVCVHICDNLILYNTYIALDFKDNMVCVLNELGEETFYSLFHFQKKSLINNNDMNMFEKNYFHVTENKYLVPVEIDIAFSNINIENTLSYLFSPKNTHFQIEFLCYTNKKGNSIYNSYVVNGKSYTHITLKKLENTP